MVSLIFMLLHRDRKTTNSEPNGNKHLPNLIFSKLLGECNLDLVLSFSNILSLLYVWRIYKLFLSYRFALYSCNQILTHLIFYIFTSRLNCLLVEDLKQILVLTSMCVNLSVRPCLWGSLETKCRGECLGVLYTEAKQESVSWQDSYVVDFMCYCEAMKTGEIKRAGLINCNEEFIQKSP
jgi:hypothetical protein